MVEDAGALARFYASPHGRTVITALRARLRALWPVMPGTRTLGLGYALPFLRIWRSSEGDRTVACLPTQIGPARWPRHRAGLACLAEEDRLPFPDLHFDRVLMVHALEHADNARRMLREAWRVLKDDGRLIVMVPNRNGSWAYAERTPFGQGRPFSADQLARLLEATMFRTERRDGALYMPPLGWRPLLRTAGAWERIGRRFGPRFAGVVIIEAAKDMYAAIPAAEAAPARRRVVNAIDSG